MYSSIRCDSPLAQNQLCSRYDYCGQPDLVKDVPVHGRESELDDLLRLLPTRAAFHSLLKRTEGENMMQIGSWVEIKTGRSLTDYYHEQTLLPYPLFELTVEPALSRRLDKRPPEFSIFQQPQLSCNPKDITGYLQRLLCCTGEHVCSLPVLLCCCFGVVDFFSFFFQKQVRKQISTF